MKTLLVVLSDIRPELAEDYRRWYDEEHIPERLTVPGFIRATRYEAGDPVFSGSLSMPAEPPPRFLAIYEMSGSEALASEPYQRLIADPSERTRRIRSTFDLRLRASYQERFSLEAGDPLVDKFRKERT